MYVYNSTTFVTPRSEDYIIFTETYLSWTVMFIDFLFHFTSTSKGEELEFELWRSRNWISNQINCCALWPALSLWVNADAVPSNMSRLLSRTVLPVHHLKSTWQSTLHKMCCSQFRFRKPYLIWANPFHCAGIEVSEIPITAIRLQLPKIYRHCHLIDIVRRCVWSSCTLRWLASGQLTWGMVWFISTFNCHVTIT
jgi:hypothetical protein